MAESTAALHMLGNTSETDGNPANSGYEAQRRGEERLSAPKDNCSAPQSSFGKFPGMDGSVCFLGEFNTMGRMGPLLATEAATDAIFSYWLFLLVYHSRPSLQLGITSQINCLPRCSCVWLCLKGNWVFSKLPVQHETPIRSSMVKPPPGPVTLR